MQSLLRVIAAILLVALLALLTASPISSTGTKPATPAPRPPDSPSAGIPAPGDANRAGQLQPGGVTPRYTNEPAPMGIADYGLGPSGPFTLTTDAFRGAVTIGTGELLTNTSNDSVSFQLNAVLYYLSGGQPYQLWVQDVLLTTGTYVEFVDNIWNLSAPEASIHPGSLSGNGGLGVFNRITYYYDVATNTPGGDTSVSTPITVELLVNVTPNALGEPVVHFWYSDGYGWQEYDRVAVVSAASARDVHLMVDGNEYTGSGNLYDAELVMGGPGGGQDALVYSMPVVDLQLEYWNGHNYEIVRNAYDAGSDTAETVDGVAAHSRYYTLSGQPVAVLEAGQGAVQTLWSEDSVATLNVSTGVDEGYIRAYNSSYPQGSSGQSPAIPFQGGQAVLTLYPMTYEVMVYDSQMQEVGEASVNARPGSNYLIIGQVTYTVIFSLTVSGQEPPAPIDITLTFPNESSLVITSYNPVKEKLPAGTTYAVSGANTGTERWVTNAPASGVIEGPETIYLPFYEQVLVNFSALASAGSGLPQVWVSYYYLGSLNGTLAPATLWVDYGLPYGFPAVLNVSAGVRWIASGNRGGLVTSPGTIRVYYAEQFYVTLNSKIPVFALLNGTNQSLNSGWYDAGSTIQIENLPYYTGPGTRYVAALISPEETTLDSPATITLVAEEQFLLIVNSDIPLALSIGGTELMLNGTAWAVAGSNVSLANTTYYVSPGARYVLENAFPSFQLEAPHNYTADLLKQYSVIIDHVNAWYDAGSVIRLNATLPFYEAGKFMGTYGAPPGSSIPVNQPVTETLTVGPNYPVMGLMTALVALVAAVSGMAQRRRKNKRARPRSTFSGPAWTPSAFFLPPYLSQRLTVLSRKMLPHPDGWNAHRLRWK